MRNGSRYRGHRSRRLKKPNIFLRFGNWFKTVCRRFWGKYVISLVSTLLICTLIGAFLLYGPISFFRELLITSAMTTLSHKYYAYTFYDQETIDKVMDKNKVTDLTDHTSTNDITHNQNLLDPNANEIKVKPISGAGYNGFVMEVSNPAWVRLGIPQNFGTKGQKIPRLIEDYGAVAGINAGGFGDANGWGNGGKAIGLVVVDGVTLQKETGGIANIVGFNEDNILVLGRYKSSEIEALKLRDAVEFRPFLIINGVPADISGNGGWGVAPRTAIGQRRDGTVLFVIIDGRSLSSAGATIKQLQDVLIEEGAYNAANLDGGSSTVLYYTDAGGVMNNPSGSDSDGMRFLPNAWLVIDPETYKPLTDRPPYTEY